MSILKNYDVMIFFVEGDGSSIDEVIKARSSSHAEKLVMEQNEGVDFVTVKRSLTTRQHNRQFRREYIARPAPFQSGRSSRGGQYIYRHKGKKLRNRRNYPTRHNGWSSAGRIYFTWVESYSRPVAEVMGDWVKHLIGADLPTPETKHAQSYSME